MSKLQQFAQALSADAGLLEAYKADPKGVMLANGLTKQEVELVLSGDIGGLKALLGDSLMQAYVVIATPTE
ncbi:MULTISPECIES: hypothetical protein [Shewanella]|uniref:Extradiol ring-cleavage dioxygenase LigAB LigA subunit domain-containing protein n=1 Tax=Shewanella holmiensis TaxID=2952222 RepID=A0A9X2WQC5_9GAMM|nr:MULTISPECIES: hypothetical protein [Shewanella]MCT7943152.1 hypothetical protein [Shewanella holmiensis]MDP5145984.1 hypothetical protein [Shewanella sp. ULN5]